MSQAIKYETTSIDATQSAMELSALVQKYGGTRFELRWEGGLLMGVRFAIRHPGLGDVPVRLPARQDAVAATLQEKRPYSSRMRKTRVEWERDIAAQAYRVAWRHLKDFAEQVLLAVDLGILEIQEGFLWAVEIEDPQTGDVTTMGAMVAQHMQAVGQDGALRLLPSGAIEAEFTVEG